MGVDVMTVPRGLSHMGALALRTKQAGFDGTTSRIRAKQGARDVAGMAAETIDDHLSVCCTDARWDDLADSLIDEYGDVVDRLVFYNPAFDTPDRFERSGAVARGLSDRAAG